MAGMSRFRQADAAALAPRRARQTPPAGPGSEMPPATQSRLGGCRFFQIGYVVGDIAQAVAQFTDVLGATVKDLVHDLRDQHGEPSMIAKLSHVLLNGVEIELIEPRQGWSSVYGDGSPLPRSSIVLHHFGFMAGDDRQWDAATSLLAANDAPMAMSADLPAVRFAYFDTRASLGHFTEVVQRREIKQKADRPARQG
jgi:catechol 2,3-dioxygenase-like lactoylglutathione lyase family enzyme